MPSFTVSWPTSRAHSCRLIPFNILPGTCACYCLVSLSLSEVWFQPWTSTAWKVLVSINVPPARWGALPPRFHYIWWYRESPSVYFQISSTVLVRRFTFTKHSLPIRLLSISRVSKRDIPSSAYLVTLRWAVNNASFLPHLWCLAIGPSTWFCIYTHPISRQKSSPSFDMGLGKTIKGSTCAARPN